MKVGKIVPHTFVPPLFFLGARIVKEKKGYNFPYGGMMKVRLFMIVFKNYSRLGACMHTANHPEGDTPRDH